jgi:hypothetical protein
MMSEERALTTTQDQMFLGSLAVSGPGGLVKRATEVATVLASIIKDRKLASSIQGKEFVRVEGWSTLGAMLGVLPREVSVARQEDGGYVAVVELIRIHDGAIIGRGSALVGMDEKDRKGRLTWAGRAEYARRSMAITRATGKAYRLGFSWIMALAGYEPTPAEEMIDAEYQEVKSKPKNPPPQSNPKSNGGSNGHSFTAEQVKAVVEAGHAENPPHVTRMLNQSKILSPSTDVQVVLSWSQEYRRLRDEGSQAALAATEADKLIKVEESDSDDIEINYQHGKM